ncbi:MAG: N-acetylmuramoyl-L-alanine amidase [Paludibacteraceae bacterium]
MKKYILSGIFLFVTFLISAQDLTGVRIYINPGHGGYDGDDRNIVIAPYTSGDKNGFWESQSNLDKGQQLKTMLDEAGTTTFISRTTNTTADDLPLSQIVAAANTANADFMLSIHSNAGNGTANHVLMLYAGKDANDTYTYPSATPWSDKSRDISTVIAQELYTNKITNWTSNYTVRGDKTFGRTAMGWSDGYGVLRGLTVPGVISEGAMHDYIPEAYRLMNMEYKYLEAWHFYKTFCTYFKSAQIPTGMIAGAVKDRFLLNESSYNKVGTDISLPVNGAKVTLLPNNISYTTDNLNNGVYLFKNLQPGNYTVITEHTAYHSDTTDVTVTANNVTYSNVSLNKIRNTPPAVVDYSPKVALTDSVLAGASVWIKFNWDIDPASAQQAFHISPAVSGKFVFEDSYFSMRFVPDKPLNKSTVYTVTLSKSLSHFDGLSMENDFSFKFKTASRNELKLIAAYPMPNETNVDYYLPTFTFVFDKQLQTAELINGVQVYDKNGVIVAKGSRSLRHNTVKSPYGSTLFTLTQSLVPGENYIVKLAKGIQDIDGVYLPDTLRIPFTASNERITDKNIAENFETDNRMSFNNTESKNISSASVKKSSSTKLFNSYSYNLVYDFGTNTSGEAVYNFNEPTVKMTHDSVAGLHVYGDLSGNELFLILRSADDVKYIKTDSLHHNGWKFAETDLKVLNSGTDYYLSGVKIKQTSAPLSNNGSIFIDNLLVYSKIVSSVVNPETIKLRIYPNPVSDVLRFSYESTTVAKFRLYSLNGVFVKETLGNEMNVMDLLSGTYVIQSTIDGVNVSCPVIIAH